MCRPLTLEIFSLKLWSFLTLLSNSSLKKKERNQIPIFFQSFVILVCLSRKRQLKVAHELSEPLIKAIQMHYSSVT